MSLSWHARGLRVEQRRCQRSNQFRGVRRGVARHKSESVAAAHGCVAAVGARAVEGEVPRTLRLARV